MPGEWEPRWIQARQELGGGGQGTTFLVIERSGATSDAIAVSDENAQGVLKILRQTNRRDRRLRMYRESEALKRLAGHPGVPRLLDSNANRWEKEGVKLFLVTEYIRGQTLHEAINGAPCSFEQSIQTILELAETVGVCHKGGLIHRDIKPGNIVLRDNEISRPVLIDFGLSFDCEDESEGPHPTITGEDLGNRFLRLPEGQAGSANQRNRQSDVSYLVGILFFLLTGSEPKVLFDENDKQPHEREFAQHALQKLTQRERAFIKLIFSIGFRNALEERFQDIEDFRDAIKSWSSEDLTVLNERSKPIPKEYLLKHRDALKEALAKGNGSDRINGIAIQWLRLNNESRLSDDASDLLKTYVKANARNSAAVRRLYEEFPITYGSFETAQLCLDHQDEDVILDVFTELFSRHGRNLPETQIKNFSRRLPKNARAAQLFIDWIKETAPEQQVASRVGSMHFLIETQPDNVDVCTYVLDQFKYLDLPSRRWLLCEMIIQNAGNQSAIQYAHNALRELHATGGKSWIKSPDSDPYHSIFAICCCLLKANPKDETAISFIMLCSESYKTELIDVMNSAIKTNAGHQQLITNALKFVNRYKREFKTSSVLEQLIRSNPENSDVLSAAKKFVYDEAGASYYVWYALLHTFPGSDQLIDELEKWLRRSRDSGHADHVLKAALKTNPNSAKLHSLVMKRLDSQHKRPDPNSNPDDLLYELISAAPRNEEIVEYSLRCIETLSLKCSGHIVRDLMQHNPQDERMPKLALRWLELHADNAGASQVEELLEKRGHHKSAGTR